MCNLVGIASYDGNITSPEADCCTCRRAGAPGHSTASHLEAEEMLSKDKVWGDASWCCWRPASGSKTTGVSYGSLGGP